MAHLVFKRNVFVFICDYHERTIPKLAGFRWDVNERIWYTIDVGVAVRLREYADSTASNEINKRCLVISPWSQPRAPLPQGLVLYPHQDEAIKFALERNRSYLGLDPGLGKTICAALIARELYLTTQTVYVCPPFLMRNVEAEFNRWAPVLVTTRYAKAPGGKGYSYNARADVLIIPDSILARPETRSTIESFISPYPNSLLFVDEAHRFKNDEALRTRALLGNHSLKAGVTVPGVVDLFQRQIFMSGTPMPNRPIEIYPLLSKAAPESIAFMNKFVYGMEYCAGHQNDFGWDFSGASNVEALAKRVIHPSGKFMLRMKKDLLKLPPKLEEVFLISQDMTPRLAAMDSRIGKSYSSIEDLIKERISLQAGKESASELHLATYRRLLGQEKVEAACEYLLSLLDETDESILVFAVHTDTIAGLAAGLAKYAPLVITGETLTDERQAIVHQFQTSENHRVFIGNIQAAGVGFTLTKATRVVFVEFSWTPADNDQAGDRAHRIGQNKSVLVQYMVYANSIDKAVIETLLRKRKSTQHI